MLSMLAARPGQVADKLYSSYDSKLAAAAAESD